MSDARSFSVQDIADILKVGKTTVNVWRIWFSHWVPGSGSGELKTYSQEEVEIFRFISHCSDEGFRKEDIDATLAERKSLLTGTPAKIPVNSYSPNAETQVLTSLVSELVKWQKEQAHNQKLQVTVEEKKVEALIMRSEIEREKAEALRELAHSIRESASNLTFSAPPAQEERPLRPVQDAETIQPSFEGVTSLPEEKHPPASTIEETGISGDEIEIPPIPEEEADLDVDDLSMLIAPEGERQEIDEPSMTAGPEEIMQDIDDLSMLLAPEEESRDIDDLSMLLAPEEESRDIDDLSMLLAPEEESRDIDDLSMLVAPEEESRDIDDLSMLVAPEEESRDIDDLSMLVAPEEDRQDIDDLSKLVGKPEKPRKAPGKSKAKVDEAYKNKILTRIIGMKEREKITIEETRDRFNREGVKTLTGQKEWDTKTIEDIYSYIDSVRKTKKA